MTDSLPPGSVMLLGALLLPLLRGRLQAAAVVLLPVLSLAHLLSLPKDHAVHLQLFDWTLTVVRVDKLALVFGIIFHVAAILAAIYALHLRDTVQAVASMIYAGSAVAGAFAGDLITLFVCWELTALSSVFLIWASRTPAAMKAGVRYLVVQVGSGVLLLGGLLLQVSKTGSIAFSTMSLDGPGTLLIFLAFGIKCAFPLLHNWLQDSYPEATVTGTVFLSAFTTKLAVYALARGFPGTTQLVWIGALMTAFPIFYAVIENDLRRVLAYSTNNQLGFMVVGIGIGTEMSLNGTAAHAVADILFKSVLFMSMGAVLYRTGTAKGSELGGLWKSMPMTALFCMVGAASISAFPFFSGFVTKSLILQATADKHLVLTWLILVFASAGVFHHSGIKIPYFAFFGHDSGKRCREAPANMLVAMGITSALCIAIGVQPELLYNLLPYKVDYQPYTTTHVITQYQLLLFSALAFTLLVRTGLYPPELRSTNLDTDWVYRRLGPAFWRLGARPALEWFGRAQQAVASAIPGIFFGDFRRAPRSLSGEMAVAVAIGMLFIYLAFNLLR